MIGFGRQNDWANLSNLISRVIQKQEKFGLPARVGYNLFEGA